jgi:hypothetical protein
LLAVGTGIELTFSVFVKMLNCSVLSFYNLLKTLMFYDLPQTGTALAHTPVGETAKTAATFFRGENRWRQPAFRDCSGPSMRSKPTVRRRVD